MMKATLDVDSVATTAIDDVDIQAAQVRIGALEQRDHAVFEEVDGEARSPVERKNDGRTQRVLAAKARTLRFTAFTVRLRCFPRLLGQ